MTTTLPEVKTSQPVKAGLMTIPENMESYIYEVAVTEDGKISKTVLEVGEGRTPSTNSDLQFLYFAELQYEDERGGKHKSSFDKGHYQIRNWKIDSTSTKQAQYPWFMNMILKTMRHGEKSVFKVDISCLFESATSGHGVIPVNGEMVTFSVAKLYYVVQVKKLVWRRPEPKDWKEAIQHADEDREEANKLYRNKQYEEAISAYEKAWSVLQSKTKKNEDSKVPLLIAQMKLYLNIARAVDSQAHLSQRTYFDAITKCSEYLNLDPDNQSGQRGELLYLRAKQKKHVALIEEAYSDIKEALALDPNNKKWKELFQSIHLLVQQSKKKDKQKLKRIFEKATAEGIYSDARPSSETERLDSEDHEDKKQGRKVWFMNLADGTSIEHHEKAHNDYEISFEEEDELEGDYEEESVKFEEESGEQD